MTEPIQNESVESSISSESFTTVRKRPRSTTIYSEEEAYSTRIMTCIPSQQEHHHRVSYKSPVSRNEPSKCIPIFTKAERGFHVEDVSQIESPLDTSHERYNKKSISSISSFHANADSRSSSYWTHDNKNRIRNRHIHMHVPPTILEEESTSMYLPMMTPSPSLDNIMCIDTVEHSIQHFSCQHHHQQLELKTLTQETFHTSLTPKHDRDDPNMVEMDEINLNHPTTSMKHVNSSMEFYTIG